MSSLRVAHVVLSAGRTRRAELIKYCNARRFSKRMVNIDRHIKLPTTISRRFSQAQDLKMDSDKIPDWLPKFEDLPEAPQYLVDFDANEGTQLIGEESLETTTQHSSSHDSQRTDIANIEQKESAIAVTDNIYDTRLVLDGLQNNSIMPSPSKHQFTLSLRDIPTSVYQPMEEKTPMTAEEAANWPVPPWHSPDFIEPRRDDKRMVDKRITKYPEMFGGDVALYKANENEHLMSYEERVSAENIKQQHLMKKQQEENALRTRKDPIKVRKASVFEDDGFRLKAHVFMVITVCVAYFHFRVRPKFANKYGYQGKDVERNDRLARLPIHFRQDGDIVHEQQLAHLTTFNDSLLLKSDIDSEQHETTDSDSELTEHV